MKRVRTSKHPFLARADYTVKPTGSAANLFLLSGVSSGAPETYMGCLSMIIRVLFRLGLWNLTLRKACVGCQVASERSQTALHEHCLATQHDLAIEFQGVPGSSRCSSPNPIRWV